MKPNSILGSYLIKQAVLNFLYVLAVISAIIMMFDMLDRNETINMDKYHDKAVEFGRMWDAKPDLYSIQHINPTHTISKHHQKFFENTLNQFISFFHSISYTLPLLSTFL